MQSHQTDPLKRFSSRVENYVKYRPGYPQEMMEFLKNNLNLKPSDRIADIGSGTGILSEMLLKNNNIVYAVEPNKEMREAAEKLLNGRSNFISIDGTAESSGLDSNSIDLITSAQAFHWFNHDKAKIEFNRILKNDGLVVLIWNSRVIDSGLFMIEYEKLLLEFSTDYTKVNHTNIDKNVFEKFFKNYQEVIFSNKQLFDFDGLKGRLLSSSYAPDKNSAAHSPMMDKLEKLFNEHQRNGTVDFIYNTEVYYGKL